MFAPTLFLSAFLLFLIQPLSAKYILPWFGGGPAVWTTCLLFFQAALLTGYAYAHGLVRLLRPKGQAAVHLAVLVGATALLPVIPAEHWKPSDPSAPTLRILLLLAATLGLPVFALAATAPLLQAWFARSRRGISPFRLYAISNVGSVLALLSYPFAVEPSLSRRRQAAAWSIAFVVFALSCAACARAAFRSPAGEPPREEQDLPAGVGRRWFSRLLWFALPAAASVILLGTTNTLTLDVAPVPFLWVLPLCAYLVTFILCFDHPRWYARKFFSIALVPAAAVLFWLMLMPTGRVGLAAQITLYCAILFVCCMVCHGELNRLRPPAGELTAYYLAIAAGGALGGLFVAIVSPRIFTDFAELRWGVLACCLLLLLRLASDPRSKLYRLRPPWAWFIIMIGITIGAGLCLAGASVSRDARRLVRLRNFYGVLTAAERYTGASRQRILEHGRIIHGLQFTDPALRHLPFSYYGPHGGPTLLMETLRHSRPRLHIGVLGLGAGSIAAFGRAGDEVRFYEIDPDMERVARTWFTYLADSPARIGVVLGDGRLSLEREPAQDFDVLFLDAFSGDSVPVHLLTREAFDAYLRHLRPNGVIAVNITNKFLDLRPVIARAAERFHLGAILVTHAPASGCPPGEFGSAWAFLSTDSNVIQELRGRGNGATLQPRDDVPIWTDDHTSLWRILRREQH